MRRECLAVIPARRGSKGVRRKNLRTLGGIPLVCRSIRAAHAADTVHRVVVSTDCSETAQLATDEGAEVIIRPDHLATDDATSESAVLHCLDTLREQEGYWPELVMLVQCTSPFTAPADLDGLVRALLEHGADSAFTAVPFHHFVWSTADGGLALPVNHSGAKRARRQDRPPQLLEDGGAYLMKTEIFTRTKERFCGNTTTHLCDRDWSIEIDSEFDLRRAEAVVPLVHSALPALSGVSTVVLDFDGVLTDNAVYVAEDGRESVRCSRSDGFGLEALRSLGIRCLIMSKERNAVVAARAQKLEIECIQGQDDKLPALRRWLETTETDPSSVIFVGNDLNDLECMTHVGIGTCPADAHPRVKAVAGFVLTRDGGQGAVRELCDLIAMARLE